MGHQADETHNTISVRGTTLAVYPEGEGAGVPLLWGHGLTSSQEEDVRRGLWDWSSITDICRVLRFDARGHGRSSGSPTPDDYRWEHLANDLLELGERIHLPRFVAGGVSMGAAVALWAACLAPTKIEALILGAPPPAWELRKGVKERYQASAHIVEKYGLAELNRRTSILPPPDIFRGQPERVHARISVDETYLPAVMRGAAESDLPAIQHLRSIRQPTLILAWAYDNGHPVAIAERLATALPTATLYVATDLDSILQWPSVVREFLEGLNSAAESG